MELFSIVSGKSLESVLFITLRRVDEVDVVLDVRNSYLDYVISFLEKNFVLYKIVDRSDNYTRLRLTVPERYVSIHPRIEIYSRKLMDPELFKLFIEKSEVKEHGTIHDPRRFIEFLKELTLQGNSFLVILRTEKGLRGAVLISSGSILGVWSHSILHETGRRALRQLFYYGPYNYVVLKIKNKGTIQKA